MPKKYIYTKRGKTQNYDGIALERAVDAVQKGALFIRKAFAMFHVPRSTIGDRISGKHELHVRNGRPPHIPLDKIVKAVVMATRCGIMLISRQVLNCTSAFCKQYKIGFEFANFKAGKGWWVGVKKRHPELAVRKPETGVQKLPVVTHVDPTFYDIFLDKKGLQQTWLNRRMNRVATICLALKNMNMFKVFFSINMMRT